MFVLVKVEISVVNGSGWGHPFEDPPVFDMFLLNQAGYDTYTSGSAGSGGGLRDIGSG